MIGAVFGLLSFTLLARFIPKEEFGVWTVFMAIVTLFDMGRNGLVGKPLIRFCSEHDDDEGRRALVVGSSWSSGLKVSFILSLLVSGVCLVIYFISHQPYYLLYALFFVPVSLISLPHQMATWVQNTDLRFDRMTVLRIVMQTSFILFILVLYWAGLPLYWLFIFYLLSNLLSSLVALFTGWGEHFSFKKKDKAEEKKLFDFGKFSMGSLLASTLLTSSDTFIIMAFLGPKAVALYEVPQRLLGMLGIPLRALSSHSFPGLVRSFKQGDSAKFQQEFNKNTGFAFLMLFPVALVCFVFAEQLVVLLGGADYAEAAPILRMFSIYMVLSPLDRYAGVALDVVAKVKRNFTKVLIMLITNVIGDVVVLQFTDQVYWVAFVSIFTFSTGVFFGFIFLKPEIRFQPLILIKSGLSDIKSVVKNLVRNS